MGAVLDQRRRQVLQAVICDYVETAEPVGSRSVAKRYHFGLSPATIRNTMADLEEMGYLSQPHPSAGRLPTDKAYRLYVDELAREERQIGGEVARLRQHYSNPQGGAERLMEETSARLSVFSRMTGVLLAPPLKQTYLARLELIPLSKDRALAAVITDAGWVTTRTLSVEPITAAEEIRDLGRQLTRRFQGKTFQQILDEWAAPKDPLDPLWTRTGSLADQILSLLSERTLYVSGAINMLEHPEFWEIETMRPLLKALEEKARLIDLLSEQAREGGVQVMIGNENPCEEMCGCSLVTSSYTYRDHVLGTLGVVGPKRMPYGKVIALVEEASRLVSQALSRHRQELYLPS
jgi:heat-inducible transcriptional repressor